MIIHGPSKSVSENAVTRHLDRMYRESPSVPLTDSDRVVIFSDLHMGDRSQGDDFYSNGDFFRRILDNHYLNNGYKLVLNGDIDELQRYPLRTIVQKWKDLYRVFAKFDREGRLFKLYGNHDFSYAFSNRTPFNIKVHESVKFRYKHNDILIFHGHQGSGYGKKSYLSTTPILRYLAKPLKIKNYSVALDNAKRITLEQKIYSFAKNKKIVAIIGHTHRPLFETLSKIDSVKFKIENLCREYQNSKNGSRPVLEGKIRDYNRELEHLISKDRKNGSRESLYASGALVPCLFNSGCAIGKRGITAIEIYDGKIALVHWFDSNISDKYFSFNGYLPQRVEGSDDYRLVLKEDDLDYVFTRINLLS